jgi:hypothetical protein
MPLPNVSSRASWAGAAGPRPFRGGRGDLRVVTAYQALRIAISDAVLTRPDVDPGRTVREDNVQVIQAANLGKKSADAPDAAGGDVDGPGGQAEPGSHR